MAYITQHRLDAVVGHAHPSIVDDEALHVQESISDLPDLVSNLTLDIVIRGLANQGLPLITAFFLPDVRRSPLTKGAVQHLDTVSCWKGLSQSRARELSTWERLFEESLAVQIKEHLQRRFVVYLSKCHDASNETLLVLRMANFLVHEQANIINISIPRLVHSMLSQLYNARGSKATQRTLEWSLASQALPDFVYNLVRIHDCFFHTLDGPKIMFDISHSYADGIMTAFAKVLWQPPKITFSNLSSHLVDGETYRITPGLASADPHAENHSGFCLPRDEATYTVTKSSLSFLWNQNEGCFYAPVSYDPKSTKGGVLKTIVSANITTRLHGGVRYERVSRYVIELRVSDEKNVGASCGSQDDLREGVHGFRFSNHEPSWLDPLLKAFFPSDLGLGVGRLSHRDSPWVPSYTSTPLSKIEHGTSRNSQVGDMAHRARTDSVHSPESADDSPMRWGPSYDQFPLDSNRVSASSKSDTGSPGKRKASYTDILVVEGVESIGSEGLQQPDQSVDAKRRKLGEPDGIDFINELAAANALPDDSNDEFLHPYLARIPASTWYKKHENSSMSCIRKSNTAASTQPSLSRPAYSVDAQRIFASKGRNKHAFPALPVPGPSYVNAITQPVTASTRISARTGTLSQEQIQHNYREFEERQKQKAAEKAYYAATILGFDGVVSHTDVNDISMERIFLDDGEVDETGNEADD